MTVGQKINLQFICFRVFITTSSMNTLTRMADRVLVGKTQAIILKWILKEWDDQAGTRLMWFTTGTDDGLLRMHNDPPGSIKCEEFLD